MAERIDGLSLGLAATGTLFVYAGIKGLSIPHAVQSLVQGQQPAGNANPVTGTLTGTGEAPQPGVSAEGGVYDSSQLRNLWVMAGGDPGQAATAACIAGHESGGNSGATSPNPDGGTNVGLWQLDTSGKGAGYTVAQLKDPLTNARLAVAGSSNGTDWSAWSTAPLCGV